MVVVSGLSLSVVVGEGGGGVIGVVEGWGRGGVVEVGLGRREEKVEVEVGLIRIRVEGEDGIGEVGVGWVGGGAV